MMGCFAASTVVSSQVMKRSKASRISCGRVLVIQREFLRASGAEWKLGGAGSR